MSAPHCDVPGGDVTAQQDAGRRIERGAQAHTPWSDAQWKPNLRPKRKFRVAAWIGDIASIPDDALRLLYTRSKDDNQVLAHYLASTGHTVIMECWQPDHTQDELNRGWAMYGHADPVVAP